MVDERRLPIAVRAYTKVLKNDGSDTKCGGYRRPDAPSWQQEWPALALVFDTETRTDLSQRFMVGCYRVLNGQQVVEVGLILPDDPAELDAEERAVVAAWGGAHPAVVRRTREEFLKQVFFPVADQGRGVVVGFNLPFDLSRLAVEASPARGRYAGGFSFCYLTYTDEHGRTRPDPHVPRIAITSIDNKRARIGFTSRWKKRDPKARWDNAKQRTWRGHFLDLRTLAFALTGSGHSLASACAAFGTEHPKGDAGEFGRITRDLLDYAENDVRITAQLSHKLLDEYRRHPIARPPDRVYSPASVGKAYLQAMRLALPTLRLDPALALSVEDVLGFAMAS